VKPLSPDIFSTPTSDRMLIHAPGCNATFGAADVRYDLLETARLFHFGYPPLMERKMARNWHRSFSA